MNDNYNDMLQYFSPQYGHETKDLLNAMLAHEEKVALINPFIYEEANKVLNPNPEPNLGPFIGSLDKDQKPYILQGLLSHYFLDRSSCLAPLSLPLAPKDKVLDMCGAPGGKLLYLLSKNQDAHFVANDISKERLRRLRTVLDLYVPQAYQQQHISITNKDATYFGLKEPQCFDKVLLDAPCGSEAHVLKTKRPFRPQKSLPFRQYSLLCSALLAAKEGGYVVYATCSINKDENEGVIKKLLKKKSKTCSLVPYEHPLGEKGDYGLSVLPHLHGAGPAFISLIQKISA